MTTQILAKFENSLRTFRPNERFSQCIRHGASPVIATHPFPFPFPFPFLVLPGACFALVSSPTVYFACNCCCSCCSVCPVSCFFWHIKCSVLSDEMRLLGAACMIGRAVQEAGKGACHGGQGGLPALHYMHIKINSKTLLCPCTCHCRCVRNGLCSLPWQGMRGDNLQLQGEVAFVVRVSVCVCAGLVFNFLQMFN